MIKTPHVEGDLNDNVKYSGLRVRSLRLVKFAARVRSLALGGVAGLVMEKLPNHPLTESHRLTENLRLTQYQKEYQEKRHPVRTSYVLAYCIYLLIEFDRR